MLAVMQKRLPRELYDFLHTASQVAQSQGQMLFLVGGAVRDLLLERDNLDFDLVVEGDAIALARHLARASGDRVVVHRQFGTAKVHRGNLTIDLATARSEAYSSPGALPDVTPGTIEDDLFRRDFTINAMAIDLTVTSLGNLLDPHGGRRDLEHGLIRILHDRSFIDDATRILRALRYEHRLGFRLEERTERLLRHHVSMLNTISGDRIRHELELNLDEDHAERLMRRAEQLGVLRAIHPAMRADGWLSKRLGQTDGTSPPGLELYLLLLAYRLSSDENEQFMERLNLRRELQRKMRHVLKLRAAMQALAEPGLPPSKMYYILKDYSAASIEACALACDSPTVRQRLGLYLGELRNVKISLDGEALQQMGLRPGPRLGKVLRQLLEAKLDGKVATREEEETLVKQWLKKAEGDRVG